MVRFALEAIMEGKLRIRAGSLVGDSANIVDTSLAEPSGLVLGEHLGTFLRPQELAPLIEHLLHTLVEVLYENN